MIEYENADIDTLLCRPLCHVKSVWHCGRSGLVTKHTLQNHLWDKISLRKRSSIDICLLFQEIYWKYTVWKACCQIYHRYWLNVGYFEPSILNQISITIGEWLPFFWFGIYFILTVQVFCHLPAARPNPRAISPCHTGPRWKSNVSIPGLDTSISIPMIYLGLQRINHLFTAHPAEDERMSD